MTDLFTLFVEDELPPLSDYERAWLPRLQPWAEPPIPIADREGPLNPCEHVIGTRRGCAYGMCNGSGAYGCGGCCGCLGGCLVAYENEQTAPHVWTGDPA